MFLGGYKDICRQADKLLLPKKPKLIWSTSNADDELFKFWAAKKVMNGTKLCIGQHGGGPWHKFNTAAEIEFENADYYFSTGKNKSFFLIIKKDTRIRYLILDSLFLNRIIHIAIIKRDFYISLELMPRYSFDIRSFAISSNFENYIIDQEKFLSQLDLEIKYSLQAIF